MPASSGENNNNVLTRSELHAESRSRILKQLAAEAGFLSCRISEAVFLEEEAPRLERWLQDGRHGNMAYMANHFDKRLDPRLLVEGCRSVVTLSFNYFPERDLFEHSESKISRYAYGEDYHRVLKDKLKQLLNQFRNEVGEVGGRVFVDSAPVLEKAWAVRNGTGWLGKNGNLIRKGEGSYFFLCEMLLDIVLAADAPLADHCGTCTACMDACPTDAIFRPYEVDGSRCISYLTIELKEAIPEEFSGKTEGWVFGCDICQEVCPWNKRFSLAHQEPRFQPSEAFQQWTQRDWLELTESVFDEVFAHSALRRTGFKGFMRNLSFSGDPDRRNNSSGSASA
jgi:epoxyqueuosine reductase